EDGIRDLIVTGVQTCALPISPAGTQSVMGIAGRALGGGRVNNDDGTFELRGLAGPQLIRVNNIPTGWVLKSIALEGEDITDAARSEERRVGKECRARRGEDSE